MHRPASSDHSPNPIVPPDVAAAHRSDLLASHVVHEFDETLVRSNLEGCYGLIMRQIYQRILDDLPKARLLDCGCGFGLFSHEASKRGLDIVSLDIDDQSIRIAQQLFGLPVRKESIYKTSLPDKSRDVAVFFDSIQHLDLQYVLPELERLGVKAVIVYESNVHNPLLRFYRAATGHEESHQYPPSCLVHTFQQSGFRLRQMRYDNLLSLPISGGLQRRPLPLLHRFPRTIFKIDSTVSTLARLVRLDRFLGLRFTLYFEK
jgi:SAM-dependent methyltransferase